MDKGGHYDVQKGEIKKSGVGIMWKKGGIMMCKLQGRMDKGEMVERWIRRALWMWK